MPQVFSEEQRILLSSVLNVIIPPEGVLPGAGDLGLGGFVEEAVAASPEKTKLFIRGLREIEIDSSRDGGFVQLSPSQQEGVLRTIEVRETRFFEELVRQTYNGYYTDTRVFEVIGFTPQTTPPGETSALLDESLLEKQRRRAPFWTRV